MRKLILVKHALPEIKAGIPANRWHLSEEGRFRCKSLADRLGDYRPDVIVASLEPKAAETGQLVAECLEKPFETAEGLHEHDRNNVGFLPVEEFREKVATFFAQPEQLIFGRETAIQARIRFTCGVKNTLAKHSRGSIVIVAHGTVITLFVSVMLTSILFCSGKHLDCRRLR